MSPDANTMPKLASAVNIPPHARSSHCGREMAQASLDEDDAWEDDFQTPHMLVHHMVWRGDNGCEEPANVGMGSSSPG